MATKISSLNIPDMPRDDMGATYWLKNFARCLAENQDIWPLVDMTAEESERITALAAAFREAHRIANCPSSNTSPNVLAKTLARNEAVLAVREVVKAIKGNPDISDSQRITLGIEPRSPKQRREIARRAARERLVHLASGSARG
jgi:hypothetical protein